MVKLQIKAVAVAMLLVSSVYAGESYIKDKTKVPDLKMADTGLSFKQIEGYQDYKIVATHFRTDKNELRYILANTIAYNAMLQKKKVMPDGSKVVKIGWSVKKMELYPDALEADKLQRVEYMIKDSKRFNTNGDNWGYARFVKKGDKFVSWDKGGQGCISCHAAASSNDFLFTRLQNKF